MLQDWQLANLRHKEFRNKNLIGENFSNTDIRGVDFSYTNLTNANFRRVKAGLSPSWSVGLIFFSLILAFFAGLVASYGGAVYGHLVMGNVDGFSFFGFIAAFILAIFLFFIISRGLETMRPLAEITMTGLIVTTIFLSIIVFSPEHQIGLNIAIGAEFTILGLIGISTGILDMAMGVAVAKAIVFPYYKTLTILIALFGSLVGAALGVREIGAFFIAGIVAIITVIVGTRIGLQAMLGNPKYWLIRWLTLTLVAMGGTKFIGANLTDADFTQATLTHTDFSNANLTRTRWLQAKGLDFTRREVASSYETVELSVSDSINPQTAALALQQLAQKYADKFQLLAIEGAGRSALKLHTKVTESDNALQLSGELNQFYRQIHLVNDQELTEKTQTIEILEKLLTKAIEKPNYYFDTEGEVTMTQSKGNVNISETSGNISGIAAAGENQTMTGVAIGEISGSVTNTISQLPENLQSDQPNLKELLIQLQQAIETEAELPDEDKVEALEQVRTLAEAGQAPEDNVIQKAARTAMKILRGTTAGLSQTAKLVVACNKLLPEISILLALI